MASSRRIPRGTPRLDDCGFPLRVSSASSCASGARPARARTRRTAAPARRRCLGFTQTRLTVSPRRKSSRTPSRSRTLSPRRFAAAARRYRARRGLVPEPLRFRGPPSTSGRRPKDILEVSAVCASFIRSSLARYKPRPIFLVNVASHSSLYTTTRGGGSRQSGGGRLIAVRMPPPFWSRSTGFDNLTHERPRRRSTRSIAQPPSLDILARLGP